MAEGTIRIVRNPASENGGKPNQPPQRSQTGGIVITPEPAAITGATSGQHGTGQPTGGRRKHSETKRAALSVEDRDNSGKVGNVQPNRTTPGPNVDTNSARVYHRRKPARYMPESESEVTAKYLLSAVEMVGTVAAGPAGEMTDFERGLMTPPLKRVLQRTPLGVIEKTTPLIDICFLVMGGAIYFSRVSGGIKFPSRPQTKGVHEDRQSPQARRSEDTVQTTRPGDMDGIAVPIPDAITRNINGAI